MSGFRPFGTPGVGCKAERVQIRYNSYAADPLTYPEGPFCEALSSTPSDALKMLKMRHGCPGCPEASLQIARDHPVVHVVATATKAIAPESTLRIPLGGAGVVSVGAPRGLSVSHSCISR